MRLAVFGMISDGGASSAGSFTLLLRTLLEQGASVDFYGVPAFTRPASLEGMSGFAFKPQRIEAVRTMNRLVWALRERYLRAFSAQLGLWAYQRDAILQIERAHAQVPYDFVLCLDTINLWPSRLPVVSWPQGPPNSEWAALRRPAIRRAVAAGSGPIYSRLVHGFYAFRWLQAKFTHDFSDLVLCGSDWAKREWVRFGVPPRSVTAIAYPIALHEFEGVPPLTGARSKLTFLWLGRGAPRKRLDLVLEAFTRVRERVGDVEALLVGNFGDPFAERILAPFRGRPGITIQSPIPRTEVASVFAAADVVVQPSESENFGFAVAEALAAGRPVVVGPTNGTADYAGGARFAFDTYDVPAVAQAMERARDAVLRDGPAVSAAARRAALEHFEPPRVAARLLELAGSLCAERRAARMLEASHSKESHSKGVVPSRIP
jgi:glycosyltransferase involved in cell wall biosynthesis